MHDAGMRKIGPALLAERPVVSPPLVLALRCTVARKPLSRQVLCRWKQVQGCDDEQVSNAGHIAVPLASVDTGPAERQARHHRWRISNMHVLLFIQISSKISNVPFEQNVLPPLAGHTGKTSCAGAAHSALAAPRNAQLCRTGLRVGPPGAEAAEARRLGRERRPHPERPEALLCALGGARHCASGTGRAGRPLTGLQGAGPGLPAGRPVLSGGHELRMSLRAGKWVVKPLCWLRPRMHGLQVQRGM